MIPLLDTYDWEQAFGYAQPTRCAAGHEHGPRATLVSEGVSEAPFTREDVKRIIASVEGENDGPPWVICGELNDGRFFALSAWCDYTGWDCQAGGSAFVAASEAEVVRFGLDKRERELLGIALPTEAPAA